LVQAFRRNRRILPVKHNFIIFSIIFIPKKKLKIYFRKKIKTECSQIEEIYLKRLDMLEKLLNKKSEERLDEFRQQKENELEKLREQSIQTSLELRSLNDENLRMKEEVNRLLKSTDELNEKLKEKTVEYDLIVDKNNYITTNLLNSTAINSSVFVQNSMLHQSKKTFKSSFIVKDKTKQNESEINCELRLEGEDNDDEEEDEEETEEETEEEETEEESEEEESEEEETEVEKTEVEVTGVEVTGVEVTGVEETGVEETGVEETGVEETGVEETGVEETGIVETEDDETEVEEIEVEEKKIEAKIIEYSEMSAQTNEIVTTNIEVQVKYIFLCF
jgi:hypothetical protein